MSNKEYEWTKFARAWRKEHPPYDNGCYLCGICNRWALEEDTVLDHITPRSADPARVFDATNIQPAHSLCNQQKGSRRIKPKVSREVYDFLESIQ